MNQSQPTAPKPGVSKWLWIVLIVVALIGAGFFAWYYLMGPGKKVATSTTTPSTTPSSTTASIATTDDWLTYENTTYGYSIEYPKELTYTENDGTKNMYFQTAKEKTDLEACSKREATECNTGNQINISVDSAAGTTNNADDLTKTLDEIVQNRVKNTTLMPDPVKITLDGQPAYEGVMIGMFNFYNIISKYNNHIYDLTITCDGETLTACKEKITDDQAKMISSFQFTK